MIDVGEAAFDWGQSEYNNGTHSSMPAVLDAGTVPIMPLGWYPAPVRRLISWKRI